MMKRMTIVLSIVLIAVFSSSVFANKPLTFEERVKVQEAIERVYYNHRIWPKENPQPKPPFEKMVTKEQIEAKVTDYLKKCSALETFWQRPIIASQLQAEMDRMAKGTKDATTLNELFAALNNDPYLIAECLARPALADRLIHNWYSNDERFHGETRKKTEEALKTLTTENFCESTEGQYSKMKYKLEINHETEELDTEDHAIKLPEHEFEMMIAEIPEEGKISQVIEKNECFVVTHTTFKSEVEIEIESLSFAKQSLDGWLKSQDLSSELPGTEDSSTSLYMPPTPESACTEGWDNGILDDLPGPRFDHSAVWTGSEMIVWGGMYYHNGLYDLLNTGGRYNPSTDNWVLTSTGANCPSARDHKPAAVWTGTEMIIWGGNSSGGLNTGGRYNPLTDSWAATSIGAGCPSARYGHTAIWTGTEMIIWGGYGGSLYNTGGRYNPSTDTWTTTSTGTNCPSGRELHTAVWTDTEMIIWGGGNPSGGELNDGGRYNPSTDQWASVSTGSGCPTARWQHTAVWTGTRMMVWGGWIGGTGSLNTGGIYNPSLDTWVVISTGTDCPSARYSHTAVWTETEMIVWGGGSSGYYNNGGRYNPAFDTWTPVSTGTNCPSARSDHTAIWSGSEMIVWGGGHYASKNSGGRYNPLSNSWVPTTSALSPTMRESHTAIWTGAEMIVWGGMGSSPAYKQDGGRYNPATDSWMATSTGLNVPSGRYTHTAVWTGTEMMIWGGYGGSNLNTGSRYNPSANTWNTISTETNCPSARQYHTAVWSGTEMIVWGGAFAVTNTGARYNPSSDTWTATSTGANVPSARYSHTAVWTGTEMIVWGGQDFSSQFSTGGRYNPTSDSWLATSTTGCPYLRTYHSAVWNGTEMIIWGGMYSGGINQSVNTGGRYTPSSNSWVSTSTGTNNPQDRMYHTAVWTGNDMVVWGGSSSSYPGSLNSGGRYSPSSNSWLSTLTGANVPVPRYGHTEVWTGIAMIIWGGLGANEDMQTGGIYYIPYAPSGLSNNSASDVSGCIDSGVLVSWPAPSNWGDRGTSTRTFDILRDSTAIATGLSEATLSYSDTTGVNGTSCLYQVRANNGCGLSTTTTGVSAADNISVIPGGLSNNTAWDIGGCADSGILVEWSSPSTWSDSGSGTRTFDVLRDSTPIATGLSESTLSYNDNSGTNGVSYLYQVRANNGCGLSTTTTGANGTDTAGTVPAEVGSQNLCGWASVPGADGYRVYRGLKADLANLKNATADGCLRYEGTSTSFDCSGDDPGLATGKLYWYLVTAYTGACEGTAGDGTGFTRNLTSSGNCF
jgi:hypothetical protein